jgi:signal transduction histidine kinase
MAWRFFIGFLLLITSTKSIAQLQIICNNQEIVYANSAIQYDFTSDNDFSTKALLKIQKNGWKNLESKKIPLSHNPECIWLKIPVDSILGYGNFDYLNINNPHINFLKCWIIKGDSIVKEFALTGDHLNFNSRPLPTFSYVFPVNAKSLEHCNIIIASDKRYTKLELPISFSTIQHYLDKNQQSKLFVGIFIGIILLLFFINTYLFFLVREKLYLWYSFYLFLLLLYIPIENGILFKYIYPTFPEINDYIRPGTLVLSIVPLAYFFNELLRIKYNLPKAYRINQLMLGSFIGIYILAMITSSLENYKLQGFWMTLATILMPCILITILLEAIYLLKKKIPFAAFAVASFGGFLFFGVITSLEQNEIIAQTNFTVNAIYIAFVFEMFVIIVALIWRFKYYKENSEKLLKENIEQQQRIFEETAAWQEKEMLRMSSLLHDTVGANLGFLRLETDNMPLTEESRNKIADHITRIGNEVRSMSHSFSPITLQDKGVFGAIDDIVKTIKNNSSINLQFEWIGEKEKIELQYQIIIYRIVQEILQNLLKHSKATIAFLQIIMEETLVSIYAEDDGVGMTTNEMNNGVGLKSIENLVQLLKGMYQLQSNKEEGFNISIEFNQTK